MKTQLRSVLFSAECEAKPSFRARFLVHLVTSRKASVSYMSVRPSFCIY